MLRFKFDPEVSGLARGVRRMLFSWANWVWVFGLSGFLDMGAGHVEFKIEMASEDWSCVMWKGVESSRWGFPGLSKLGLADG